MIRTTIKGRMKRKSGGLGVAKEVELSASNENKGRLGSSRRRIYLRRTHHCDHNGRFAGGHCLAQGHSGARNGPVKVQLQEFRTERRRQGSVGIRPEEDQRHRECGYDCVEWLSRGWAHLGREEGN